MCAGSSAVAHPPCMVCPHAACCIAYALTLSCQGPCPSTLTAAAEMNLNAADVWGHFAPMFHLVDVFAIYAITLVS